LHFEVRRLQHREAALRAVVVERESSKVVTAPRARGIDLNGSREVHRKPRTDSASSAVSRSLDQQLEDRPVLRLVHALRVPLHAEEQRQRRVFDAFDHTIR